MKKYNERLFKIIVLAILIFSINGCNNYSPFKTEHQKILEMQFSGDYVETLTPLGKLLQKNPEDEKTLYLFGISNLNLGHFNVARDNFCDSLSILISQKKFEKEVEVRNKIASEYKKIFLRFLSKPDKIKREKAEKLFVAMLTFNPDSNFLAKLEEYLESKGNSILSKNSFAIADSHFSYLARLDKNSKQRVGQGYLDLFNKVDDIEFRTVLIDRAFEISQEQNIRKTRAEHHHELSLQAETTGEAIVELKIANQSGDYKSELQAKQEQLKHEQLLALVKKAEKERGKALHVKVKTPGELETVATFTGKRRVYYLATNDFLANDGGKCNENWKKSTQSVYFRSIRKNGKTDLKIGCDKFPTDIYLWFEKI